VKYVRVAAVSDIPEESAVRVELKGEAIAVVKSEGRIYAVSDTCTHEEASLSAGFVEGEVIECPRHGAQYDIRTGEALSFPAISPLRTYEVKIEGDEILIGLEGAGKNEGVEKERKEDNVTTDSGDRQPARGGRRERDPKRRESPGPQR